MIEDWTDRKTNLIKCPACGSDVVRMTVPWQGEKYLCVNPKCAKEEIIFSENSGKPKRRGVCFS